MNNPDTKDLQKITKAIAQTSLKVNGDIAGEQDTYEIHTYVDEVVILDSLGQEVLSEERLTRSFSSDRDIQMAQLELAKDIATTLIRDCPQQSILYIHEAFSNVIERLLEQ